MFCSRSCPQIEHNQKSWALDKNMFPASKMASFWVPRMAPVAADPGNYPGVDLSRVPFFGEKKATLLFQFPAVFWCVITGLV